MQLPQRSRLYHTPPSWVEDGSYFFITLCCTQRGQNFLAQPKTFSLIAAANQHYVNEAKWWCHIMLAMPDHLHTILSFNREKPMDKTVRDWKRYVAKTTGIRWQDGFFDHRLRGHESLEEKSSYIRMNPVRAKLCTNPDDWPYLWCAGAEPTAR